MSEAVVNLPKKLNRGDRLVVLELLNDDRSSRTVEHDLRDPSCDDPKIVTNKGTLRPTATGFDLWPRYSKFCKKPPSPREVRVRLPRKGQAS